LTFDFGILVRLGLRRRVMIHPEQARVISQAYSWKVFRENSSNELSRKLAQTNYEHRRKEYEKYRPYY